MQKLVTAKAGLTGLSGAATTFTTAAAIIYALFGKAFSKAAVAGGTSPTVDAVTGTALTLTANTGMVVLWVIDAAGNIGVLKGDTVALDASGNFITAPQFPTAQDAHVPFAYSVHKAGSTTVGTWTFGVSNWNAAGLTHTVTDLLFMPDRPQTA